MLNWIEKSICQNRAKMFQQWFDKAVVALKINAVLSVSEKKLNPM